MRSPIISLMFGSVCAAAAFAAAMPPGNDARAQGAAPKPAPATAPGSWDAQEGQFFAPPVQLTFADRFVKAGEAYFKLDFDWLRGDEDLIIFQATEKPAGDVAPDPFYAMYVAKLAREDGKDDSPIVGLADIVRVSPEGSANTCGWFHPRSPSILFGSTVTRPSNEERSGFQVGTRKYVWMFPSEMEIVGRPLAPIGGGAGDGNRYFLGKIQPTPNEPDTYPRLAKVFEHPNYDAECSYDPTGRFILYAHIEDEAPDHPKDAPPTHDANLYIYDTQTKQHHAIVTAKGYDGGPFFSPDGRSICYRSDREGNDLLQLFVADLKYERNDAGDQIPVGIEREWQITDNQHVNWAPYWHPSGTYIVYASSEAGHMNYELFAIEVPWDKLRAMHPIAAPKDAAGLCRHVRLTYAPGADVLPAFSFDGKYLMWTSQRQGAAPGEQRASSQLWIANWKGVSFEGAAPATP